MLIKKSDEIKTVDCALIFMLEEEQKLFLKNNKDFIVTGKPSEGFTEFCFFDKSNIYRTGVMCSNGKEMGNTEACKLFYKISRNYSASLYINLGVAGLIDGVNIGDVIVVDRLSTSGEHNDNISKTQIQDYNNLNSEKIKKLCFSINQIVNKDNVFAEITSKKVDELKSKLSKKIKSKYTDFDLFKYNEIVPGWCLTVPQVIKDKSKYDAISDQRKLNIVDMEAYYLATWYDYIKDYEPKIMQTNTSFLVFKSVSDYGDINKHKFEDAGSRELAMHNLYTVVSNYCTNMHEFPLISDLDLDKYFSNEICNKCIDELASNRLVEKDDIENLFKYIIHIDDQNNGNIETESSITSILTNLEKNSQALLLTGRSGTGKSTYISFLYQEAKGKKVLIDFSKYPDETGIILSNLLNKLISRTQKYLVFLDGITPQSKTYDAVKKVLVLNKDKNVAFCIGNFDETIESIATILTAKENFCKIYFSGVNLHSESFEEFVDEWFNFCKKMNYKSHDSKKVILLLKNAKFNSVDLRLLNMFANYNRELPKEKLPVFIKNYIIDKYTEAELAHYWKQYLISNKANKDTDKNQYYNSVAITNGIIELFISDEFTITDDIKAFINRDFILSDDMNLILEHDLKYRKNGTLVVDNIIKLLTHNITKRRKDYSIDISVETQLIYNICRVINSKDIKYSDFKKHIDKMASELQNSFVNGISYDIPRFIQYRTLCIVEAICFSNKNHLEQFNKILLNEENGLLDYNLYFYLLYYSKREFSFSEIVNFSIHNTDYEMFCNTFFALKNIIYSNNMGNIVNMFLTSNPFEITNVITFMHLVYRIQIESKQFAEFLPKSIEILTSLRNGLEIVINRLKSYDQTSILDNIKKRIDLLVNELEHLMR